MKKLEKVYKFISYIACIIMSLWGIWAFITEFASYFDWKKIISKFKK